MIWSSDGAMETAMTALLSPLMTAEQFMDWPGHGRLGKHVLINGVIKAMAPSSGTHGILQAVIAHLFGNHLKANGSRCRVATEPGVRPLLLHKTNVRAPDVSVFSGPRTTGPEKFRPDPILICEVSSNTDDTYESNAACMTVPTLTEVLVIDSERVYAEIWRKDDASAWPKEPLTFGPGETFTLASISVSLAVDEVYADTRFGPT
jgi:Uma2 family endonuclease